MSSNSTSTSSSKVDSSVMSPIQARRYSSPPPDTPSNKVMCGSPPPPPRYGNNSMSRTGPAADAVLFEINHGRSILNPKPFDIASIDMSRHSMYKDFGAEVPAGGNRNHSGGLILASPSYPHLPSPSSPDDVAEEIDADMPQMPSPIRLLPMRRIRMRSPIAPRVSGRIPEINKFFVPIHHEEESQS